MNEKIIFIDWLVTINCSFLYCVRFRGTHALVFKELNGVPFRSYSDLPRAIWWFLSQFSWNLDCGIIRWLNSSPSSGNTSRYPLGSRVATGICLFKTQTHTHTLIWITHREPKRIACSAFSLLILFFVERKKCVCSRTLMRPLAFVGKKVHEAVDEWRTMLTVTSGFFLARNKTQHSQ
jgi:hypothetical protein